MTLTIHGNPVPQGRPRFFRCGKNVGTYDPAKSKNWKENVKWQIREQILKQGWQIQEGALHMSVIFILQKPKALLKKKSCPPHTKKPDLDNLFKGVADALTGICFKNDSSIASFTAKKEYGDTPKTIIHITSISANEN